VYFGAIRGVIRTRVGYCGGEHDSPTYSNLHDHSESIQLEFDPDVVSYQELVEVFFDNHMWATNSARRQYRNIAFYHNEEQKVAILDKINQLEASESVPVMTEVKAVAAFYYAEDYHQKWELRKRGDLADLFRGWNNVDLINSYAATKLNAHVAHSLTAQQVLDEMKDFELTEQQKIDLQADLGAAKNR